RALPAGPAGPGPVRLRGDPAGPGGGGVRPDAPGRGAPLGGGLLMPVRIDHTVTSGTFSLDGQTFDVDNNVWVVGDDTECAVIDAPHDVEAILRVVAGRRVRAILASHAHDDHVRQAPALADATGAPVLLHPADRVLWDTVHPDRPPDGELADGQAVP